MGKRSSFERIPRDFYPTPYAAVPPLVPYLRGVRTFAEPCCGDGALVRHLEGHGLRCAYAGDIATGQDALALDTYGDADAVITNPPYERKLMHALISHFQAIAPAWLLMEQDWCATKQAVPYLGSCTDIVSIGRLRWIEGTKMSSMENFAWYRFDFGTSPARSSMLVIRHQCCCESACVFNAARHIDRSVPTLGSVVMRAGSVHIARD